MIQGLNRYLKSYSYRGRDAEIPRCDAETPHKDAETPRCDAKIPRKDAKTPQYICVGSFENYFRAFLNAAVRPYIIQMNGGSKRSGTEHHRSDRGIQYVGSSRICALFICKMFGALPSSVSMPRYAAFYTGIDAHTEEYRIWPRLRPANHDGFFKAGGNSCQALIPREDLSADSS